MNKERKVYFGNFVDREHVAASFQAQIDEDLEIIFAVYGSWSYDGDAFVLLRKGEQLVAAYGNHCSCYGLEYQWRPEEATIEQLKYILEHGSKWDDYYGQEAKEAFSELLSELECDK